VGGAIEAVAYLRAHQHDHDKTTAAARPREPENCTLAQRHSSSVRSCMDVIEFYSHGRAAKLECALLDDMHAIPLTHGSRPIE
jgi:hypothetical protein